MQMLIGIRKPLLRTGDPTAPETITVEIVTGPLHRKSLIRETAIRSFNLGIAQYC